MPIYEFVCKNCGKSFDKLCSLSTDPKEVACVHCSEKKVVKKMSSFTTSNSDRPQFDFNQSGSSCSSCSGGTCSTCGD